MESFPDRTSWSTLRNLGDSTDPEAWQSAWNWLHRQYRPAMVRIARRLLTRGLGQSAGTNEAEDVVDAFLLACVEKQWLLRAEPGQGRFRVFVYVLLARFTRDWVRHARAARRRPATGTPASLDDVFEEPVAANGGATDTSMDREWVLCMVRNALDRVEERSEGNAVLLRLRLSTNDVPIEVLADQLGCRPSQVPVRTYRARRMLAEELWSELQETVTGIRALHREREVLAPFLEGYLDPKAEPSFFLDSPTPANGAAGE